MDLPLGARGALATAVAAALPLVLCGAVPADTPAGPTSVSTCLAGPDHVFMFGETAWSRARTGAGGLWWSSPTAAVAEAVWPCAVGDTGPTGYRARAVLEA